MRSHRSVLLALVVSTVALGPAVAAAPVVAESTATDPAVTVEYDGDRVTVANGTSQVVSGTADAPRGTEVLVRIRSVGNTTPRFLKTATGVVTADGTWAVAFDFSSHSAGETFVLTARLEDGSAETEVDGTVVSCEGDCAETSPSGTPTPIPEQTQMPTRAADETAPVAFQENVFVVEAGGVAAIPISLEAREEAVVVLGSESDGNYELEALVRDEDGDGRVVLYVDTALAGRGGESLSVSGGDSVDVRSETSLDSMLDPASYGASLYAGSERADRTADVGSLVVQAADAPTTDAERSAEPSPETVAATGSPGGGLGSLAIGAVVSGAFLVGGAVLAAVLLKR